jgi:hypothetical protein
LLSTTFFSCTDNFRAKQIGGTIKLDLPKGEKLVNVTWKNNNFWYLTREMKPNEKPQTYNFRESSNYGMLEGKIILIEHK